MYEWIGSLTDDEKRLRRLQKWLKLIPRPLVAAICFIAGRILYRMLHKEKERIIRNMKDLLKGHSDKEIEGFAKKYSYNLCMTLYELLIDSANLDEIKEKRFTIMGESYLEEALSHGKGVIVFTPHFGNFFYYYWLLSHKYPCLTVASADSSELKPLYMLFKRMGCKGLDYDTTPPLELIKTLKRHLKKNGVVFLLGDFWSPSFPPARFFNRETRSPAGTAMLALESEVPVVPFYGYRVKGFQHRMIFEPPMYLHKTYAKDQRTESVNALNYFMERVVTHIPEQWFYWFNIDERWEERVKQRENKPAFAPQHEQVDLEQQADIKAMQS